MMPFIRSSRSGLVILTIAMAMPLLEASSQVAPPFTAQDPGPRETPSRNGAPFENLPPLLH